MLYARENSTSANELAFYTYDTLSRRQTLRLGGQSTNTVGYGYEADSDLSSLTHTLNTLSLTLGYTHNNSHQIKTINASDSFYLPQPSATSSTAYVPNALNEYASVGGQTSGYDLNGNLLTWYPPSGQSTYTYDSENRLATAAVNGSSTASISYDYDGLGRRVSKTVSGVSTSYLLDGDEEIAEYSGTTVLRRYITGTAIDDRIAHAEGSLTTAPPKTYYHVNHQGSVVAMTDAAGNVSGCAGGILCQRLAYDEYGNLSTSASGTGEPFQYTGRRFDVETGLNYYRARYYSPQLARFLQVDPVGYKDDLDLYTYVGNDPTNKADSTGTEGMFSYTPAEAQALAVTQQMNAAEAKAATSYVGRQLELKITAAVLGTVGLVAKSPTLMKLSLVAAAAALTDQKVTTGHVDPREVAVTAIGAVPGVEGVATAVSGMKEVGEAAQVGQEFAHAGAATAGAALAVGEAMPNHGSNSAPKQPSSEQRQENTTSRVKTGCTPGANC
ncbi:MAG TPA: RHS repeat-associated core domain-containing protein [Steroidobacteraceae bacterium]|jgi:RHS repeat-associated protein